MLDVRCNAIKRYNRIPAVDGVKFAILPGEAFRFPMPEFFPSGSKSVPAGKSSRLACLERVERVLGANSQ
jgi:hypothetical protein